MANELDTWEIRYTLRSDPRVKMTITVQAATVTEATQDAGESCFRAMPGLRAINYEGMPKGATHGNVVFFYSTDFQIQYRYQIKHIPAKATTNEDPC